MANVTPDTASPEVVFDRPFLGTRHQRFPFLVQTIADKNFWDSEIPLIRRVAWEALAVDPEDHTCSPQFDSSDGRIVFHTDVVGGVSGYLHVWSGGLGAIPDRSSPFVSSDGPLGNIAFANWLNVSATNGSRAGTVTSSILGDLTSFSWEFWFRPPTAPTSGVLWHAGIGGLSELHARFSVNASSQVVFDNRDEAGPTLTSTTALSAGTWTHISGTYDNATGNVQLHINGVLEDSDTGAVWTGRNVWLQPADIVDSGGEFCDTRAWNFARSAAQVLADYGGPLVGDESGLVAYWPGDGSGNRTPNVVSPGNADMQRVNGTWEWKGQISGSIAPDSVASDLVDRIGHGTRRLQHTVHSFMTAASGLNAANGDWWDSPVRGIETFAWEGDAVSDDVAWEVTSVSAAGITRLTTVGPSKGTDVNGYLHLWSLA